MADKVDGSRGMGDVDDVDDVEVDGSRGGGARGKLGGARATLQGSPGPMGRKEVRQSFG